MTGSARRTGSPTRRSLEIAQADVPAPVTVNGKQPAEFLSSASEKLKEYTSVRASISEKVSIDTHTFTMKGSYLQGQNLQLRMEFSGELGGLKASVLEVCDGQVLWSRHDLGEKDQTQISRRDVRQILQAADQAEQQIKVPEDRARFHSSIVADLAIGGLPALLAAFAKDYEFKKVTAGKIDDRDVVILEGTWNSKYREMWLGTKAKDKKPPTLPYYIPELVRISLDKETEFPRRVEYLKQPVPSGTATPIMTMDFTKVVFNGKVNRDDFVFIPPERPAHVDVTQMYLQRLLPPKAKDAKPAAAAEGKKG